MQIVCIIFGVIFAAVFVAFAVVLFWALWLKHDIRKIGRKLGEISQSDTNAQLITDTFDNDITNLAININSVLESNRQNIFEKDRADTNLKRSITNISHDLRTPLTSAIGYLQMLESTEIDGETRNRYQEIIKGRLETLSAHVNGLFEYARIVEGSEEIKIQEVNICDILRDTLSASYTEIEKKGFVVETDISDKPVLCLCDENALRRIMENLIKNIYLHGKDYLRVRVDGDVIEIANKADGIDDLNTERIFERFYTKEVSRTSKNTGIGLAIVKELVTRMNGQIFSTIEKDLLIIRLELPKNKINRRA